VDKQLTETVSGGGLSLSTSATYDLAGRVTSRTNQTGLVTTYAYSNGGRTVTVTHPGGFTEITDKYLDGKVKSITGTAIVPKYYTYGVNTDGTQWTKVCNASANSPNYVKTTTDVFNRTISEEKPGYTGTLVTNNFYNAQGLLIKTTPTGKADTLYAYDDFNNRTMSCLDLNENGTIDTASADRISESVVSFQSESSQWWSVAENKVYNDSGDAITTGITKKQLTGFGSGVIANSISIDINGNETVSTTTLDCTNKTLTQTVNVPDSTADEVSVTVNGLLSTMSTKSSLSYSYSYDGIGRQISQTDPRTGTSVTHYNSLGQVDYTEDAAGKRTSFTYESSTGRRASIVNSLNKSTSYTYNSRGQISTVRGDASYPLSYSYDSYGRMTQLLTYRDSNLNNPDVTIWTYQESTGLLTSKTYADNKSVSYTYSADGKLATRTWSRGVVTNYAYNLASDLTGIDYSDDTPDVAFTYNRLGQQLTVTDAVGSRTFGYNGTFQLTSETINGIYNKVLTRRYDSLGRSTSFSLQGDNYSVAYGYDSLGRFSSVTSGSDVFTYGYLPSSVLISSISYPNNISVTKSYESNRDLVTSIENKYDTTTISKYDYTNDDLGRRTAMSKSGTAFSQSDTISYGYNDKSEVTSAVSANLATYNYGFNFDPIGNRITSTSTETGASVTRSYTANQLNQYTAIDNPTATPTYDDDGNTTNCELSTGSWSFTWDAENRLISAVKTDDTKLEFSYDYMSRRVEKKAYSWDTDHWSQTSGLRFVYDNYLQIEQLDSLDSNSIEKKRIWGAEGKIIADIDSSNTTFYAIGEANKNITEYIDNSGMIFGHYEYSPFGKVTIASGSSPDDFDFTFSCEYTDSETMLVYYNFRYYISNTGRWLNHDLIEESGGYNLYAMVSNNPLNRIDILGNGTISDTFEYMLGSDFSVTATGYATWGGGASLEVKDNSIDCCDSQGKYIIKGSIDKLVTFTVKGGLGFGFDTTFSGSIKSFKKTYKVSKQITGPQIEGTVNGKYKNDYCGGAAYTEENCLTLGVFVGGEGSIGAVFVSASATVGFSGYIKACLKKDLSTTGELCGKHTFEGALSFDAIYNNKTYQFDWGSNPRCVRIW
jgi:RHS repeat-associated protein